VDFGAQSRVSLISPFPSLRNGASKEISEHIGTTALIFLAQAPERPRLHHRHEQASGSQNEHIG
jgi:hypothetical protein